eukprot:m.45611 g.45611  ORF g.45611 m.45611 type:complete len:121 (+) comp10682_c0_seq1:101-463(+)
MYMDFRPYMNSSPYLALDRSSLGKVFMVFRTMGLRHLVVVNKMNQLVGMVTRKDIGNITDEMSREEFLQSRDLSRKVKYIMPENVGADEHAVIQRDTDELDHFSEVQNPLMYYSVHHSIN